MFKRDEIAVREMIVKISSYVLCLLLFSTTIFAAENGPDSGSKPNIIVILADDMGQWAMGAYGLDAIKTPTLDYLADTGVMFKNAMTPAPVCSPARASFYTGKIPSQHGVHDFLGQDKSLEQPWLEGETLLSERLKQSGYTTALIGKWHATTYDRPPQPGFDQWLSYNSVERGWQSQYKKSGDLYFSDNGTEVEHEGVQAQYLTSRAIRFIDEREADQPFFVSLNFTEPHAPFSGWPERLVQQYRQVARDIIRAGGSSTLDPMGIDALGASNLVPEDHNEQLAQYLAGIALIDDQVGRLLDALEGRGLRDNTVVVFASDHGMLMGQYGLYGKVNASKQYNFYEETIRIPLVIKAPDGIVRNEQVRSEFVDLIDLHHTILDFAGYQGELPHSPGRSMLPLLEGSRTNDWRNYQISERGNARMITNGHWKLVRYYYRDPDKTPLDYWYNQSNPMGEQYESEPPREAVREKLIATLDAHFATYEDKKWSGRNIWNIPPHNFRVKKELESGRWE